MKVYFYSCYDVVTDEPYTGSVMASSDYDAKCKALSLCVNEGLVFTGLYNEN